MACKGCGTFCLNWRLCVCVCVKTDSTVSEDGGRHTRRFDTCLVYISQLTQLNVYFTLYSVGEGTAASKKRWASTSLQINRKVTGLSWSLCTFIYTPAFVLFLPRIHHEIFWWQWCRKVCRLEVLPQTLNWTSTRVRIMVRVGWGKDGLKKSFR